MSSKYDFMADIAKFNAMYKMPVNDTPTILFRSPDELIKRLFELRKILEDEVAEVDDIIQNAEDGVMPVDLLTEIADWLGDLQVFCASEMRKFGLHNDAILGIIMQSNFSKLQADGTALFIDGKLQKGPNYWKPEPQIKRYLMLEIQAAQNERDKATYAKLLEDITGVPKGEGS